MIEEAVVAERKKTEEIKASDLRPQAHFFELVKVQNPKTGKESHFLYWWNKDRKEVIREVVNSGGIRVGYAPLIENGLDSDGGARKKITEVINSQRKKGLEIIRHQKLNQELFEEGRVKEGMLIPYFEELIKDRGKNVDEAWQYYHDAEEKAVRAKAQERTGKVYGKSVFSTSAKLRLEKQETNLGIALNEEESGLRFFNQYLNERIGVEKPAKQDDSLYEIYVKYNRDLDNITGLLQSASLEEKDKLLQAYTDIFSKRLEIHHELAEKRGYAPVKGIPEEVEVEQARQVESEIEKSYPLVVIKKEPQFVPEIEAIEEPVTIEEQVAQAEEVNEVEDFGVALSASADGLKENGNYTFALRGSGAEELVKGIIPQFKEVWEQKKIKIVDFSVNFDIKTDSGQIDIDVKVKKGLFSKRIQAKLVIESKEGVLNTVDVNANPKVIDFKVKSFNIQEIIEENIGGEKIHSIIEEWLASEMNSRGAKLENVEFRFIPEDTLQVSLVGGAK